jgi:hypothetical protein
VFAAGSLYFATGLEEWPAHGTGVENSGLQHFAVNMLTDLGYGYDYAPAGAEQPSGAALSPNGRSSAEGACVCGQGLSWTWIMAGVLELPGDLFRPGQWRTYVRCRIDRSKVVKVVPNSCAPSAGFRTACLGQTSTTCVCGTCTSVMSVPHGSAVQYRYSRSKVMSFR